MATHQGIMISQPTVMNTNIQTFTFGIEGISNTVWENMGITQIIDEHIPKAKGVSVGEFVKILAINRLIDPGSRQHVEDWYSRSGLQLITGIPPEKIYSEKLNQTLEQLALNQVEIQRDINKMLTTQMGISLDVVQHDITSTFFRGEYEHRDPEEPLINFGYNRDKIKGVEQTNIELLIDGQYGMPLYSSCYDGSKNDNTRIKPLVKELKKRKSPPVHLIIDRGLTSKGNRKALRNEGHSYTCAVKLGADVSSIIHDRFPSGANMSTRYRSGKKDHFIEEITGLVKAKKKETGKTGTAIDDEERFFLVFNPENQENAREKLNARIADAEDEIAALTLNEGRLKKKDAIRKKVNSILRKKKLLSLVSFQVRGKEGSYRIPRLNRREDRIEEKLELGGFSCLVTTDQEITAGQVFKFYHSRVKVENAFALLKGPIRLRPIYCKKEIRIAGHVFICMLAYLLQQAIRKHLNDMMIDITIPMLCRVMKGAMIIIVDGDPSSAMFADLTEDQMFFLEVFGIIVPDGGN